MFRLLVLVVLDSVMAISAVVYNVNNNLDEVMLAPYFALCNTVNIITSSPLALKVTVTTAIDALDSCLPKAFDNYFTFISSRLT